MSTRKLIIILAIALFLSVGGLLAWQFAKSPEELLQETPGLPRSEWPRIITVKEDNSDYKVVSNEFDGYEVTVPKHWDVIEVASKDGGHEILAENLTLRIFALDEIVQAQSFFPASVRFETIVITGNPAYKTSFQPTEDRLDSKGNVTEAPLENSLVISYIFPSDENAYLVSCLVSGSRFSELASLCEKQILTFKILK